MKDQKLPLPERELARHLGKTQPSTILSFSCYDRHVHFKILETILVFRELCLFSHAAISILHILLALAFGENLILSFLFFSFFFLMRGSNTFFIFVHFQKRGHMLDTWMRSDKIKRCLKYLSTNLSLYDTNNRTVFSRFLLC